MNNPIDLIKEDENIDPTFREVLKHNVVLPRCKRCHELITTTNRLLTAEFDGGVQIDFGCSKCIEKDLKSVFYNLAQQKGVNPDAVLNELRK